VYTLEDAGLRVAEVPDLAALTADPQGEPDGRPHAVRLGMDGHDWRALGDRDLVVRPTWVHWVCPVEKGSVDILARQSRQQRSRSRKAVRVLEAMSMQVCEPVDAAVLDEWAELYTAQLKRLHRGRNFFAMSRRNVLESPHALAVWRQGGRPVCGCIIGFRPESRAFVLRFSAVAAEYRDAELPRGMYAVLADMAADRGMRWITLGSDVNFYGAIAGPGLCAFKLRVGFRAVPADLFGVTASRTVVERVTNLRGLDTPVLRFEYQRIRDPAATVEDFVDGTHALDLVSVAAAGEANVVLESLPPHRRLVLHG
jgi:hypothetical protein